MKAKTKTAYRMSGRKMETYNLTYNNSKSGFNYKLFFSIIAIVIIIVLAIYFHLNGVIVFFDNSLVVEGKTIGYFDFNYEETGVSHYIFTIANGLLIGVYMSALLPLSGKRGKWITLVLVILIITFSIMSFGYVGILIYLNIPILSEKTYISNASTGLSFFISNLAFFLILYAMSLLIESEVD